ncbi:hypothetical protein A3J17_01290 [Candidatus Curtissbacteria bacterium RIFCSPLOWO2_02_FULL_40_11]|uniref:Uncharacterized protein n=2 Tax=Candidatus Curtissiibacteriota TaxID=1752717 RepID=A0A1F5GBD7_9BACT|nr:MAG: hypothetical protein A3D04_03540 [Candidatus Curtissbacteria bacterium RIFCSPHIGHO2_02_FULL_40_16b]OGE00857.1 MAG: hypothetical protein A3J17_01290 [Candidatus Curtissbacteria bacterium RIFCSPLOWO2_02_FULL_40_11]OGE14045.1 MAG: hypothetical protein A3G14_03445 [Candidatus Curtissbacteria bacterium RIFCSPLOWO2_12_FULL_38_9]
MAKKKIKQEKSHYELLKSEWVRRHKKIRRTIYKKHKETFEAVVDKFPAKEKLAHGAIGALMLSSVMPSSPAIISAIAGKGEKVEQSVEVDRTGEMLSEIKTIVPSEVRQLSGEEEVKVGEILTKYFKTHVSAELDGKRLNRSYGVIGAEQHLMRYPGDTMATHLPKELQSNEMIYSSGMAPGRGAWGYFAKSKAEMTARDIEREKWYIAVQTFAAPNYNSRLSEYRDFFKYRKMILVNTKTGQAVIVDIADVGPAVWTGKHLGGSPEVMNYIGYGDKSRKGPVLYFFVDDVEDKIPLGSIVAK